MKQIVTYDKFYTPIYEDDWVITKYGRVCKVVWCHGNNFIGYDLIPVAFTDYPPPSEYDIWSPFNLIKLRTFNLKEIEKIMKDNGIQVKD